MFFIITSCNKTKLRNNITLSRLNSEQQKTKNNGNRSCNGNKSTKSYSPT